jgi:hypothetical protein
MSNELGIPFAGVSWNPFQLNLDGLSRLPALLSDLSLLARFNIILDGHDSLADIVSDRPRTLPFSSS